MSTNMDDTQALALLDTPSITTPAAPDPRSVWSVEIALTPWLDAKHKHTQSVRTKETYQKASQEFRAALQSQGLDLDSVQAQDDTRAMQVMRDQVKQIAQLCAGFSKRSCQVKSSTMSHRSAVLSRFYGFCLKQAWLDSNPIEHVERSKIEAYTDRKALDFDDGAVMFDRFDRHKPEDVRDCASLAIALQTGHRVTALAGLRCKHVSVHRGIVTLSFERCKGNTHATVEVDEKASKALLRWLQKHYGQQVGKHPGATPLWVSLVRGCDPRTHTPRYGQALSMQAIGQICQKWTGTAHVHRLRTTFVIGMLASGASVRAIQSKRLHRSLATTSGYIETLPSAKNAHAGDLSTLFHIK